MDVFRFLQRASGVYVVYVSASNEGAESQLSSGVPVTAVASAAA